MKDLLNKLGNYGCLNEAQAYEVLRGMIAGDYNDSQIAAFLTTYMMRQPCVAELRGFKQAMMEECFRIQLPFTDIAVDIVGTGGDGKNSFNISTLAAIVTAAAGFKVIKHGNYGASSASGSSNVLEQLGYCFSNDPAVLSHQLHTANLCFLHAPLFHPAMKRFAQVRKNLGIRSFFNLLGPLTNPVQPRAMLLGVNSLEAARTYQYLLQGGAKQYAIVHSLDGYDEISLTAPFKIITPQQEAIYSPAQFGCRTILPSCIDAGSDLQEAAHLFMNVLQGKGSTAQIAVVAMNSGLAIHLASPTLSIQEGMDLAAETLQSGQAVQIFNQLIACSHEYAGTNH